MCSDQNIQVRNNIFAFGGEGDFRITKNEEHNSLFLENNIFVTDNAVMYFQSTDRDWFVDNSNLYWDYKHGGNVYSGDSTSLFKRKNIPAMVGRGYYNNGVFADPLFKDSGIFRGCTPLPDLFPPWMNFF